MLCVCGFFCFFRLVALLNEALFIFTTIIAIAIARCFNYFLLNLVPSPPAHHGYRPFHPFLLSSPILGLKFLDFLFAPQQRPLNPYMAHADHHHHRHRPGQNQQPCRYFSYCLNPMPCLTYALSPPLPSPGSHSITAFDRTRDSYGTRTYLVEKKIQTHIAPQHPPSPSFLVHLVAGTNTYTNTNTRQ